MLPGLLAGNLGDSSSLDTSHRFTYEWNDDGLDSLYENGEWVSVLRDRKELLDILGTRVRLTVAEFASERVFVHAGVVAVDGRAIVIPGKSFSGKTTLVAELVRRGALYYSDEYAVFDKDGLVWPFPKCISIRSETGDSRKQTDYPVEAFGGTAGTEPLPVGMVLLTGYKPNAKWRPRILSSGKGLIEIIRDTIPIRNDPTFTLSVLNQVVQNSVIVKSPRGDVSESADRILEFFEAECF